VRVNIQQQSSPLDPGELPVLKAIKMGIPGASDMTPEAVLASGLSGIGGQGD
jgi:hypothetical protein